MASTRELTSITAGMPASDGAGVKLTRIIGTPTLPDLDPFLMLDLFESDNPDDYIAGFPPHPHRGFETVTYILNGRMRHKDNMGHEGVIEPGGVQWMTAGRGVIHSEMPEQEEGLLKGFQLWINLPSHAKMQAPAYQEYDPQDIPLEQHDNGTLVRVISGRTAEGTQGPIDNQMVYPTYLDVTLPPNTDFEQALPMDDHAFVFVESGSLTVGDKASALKGRQLGILSAGESVRLSSAESETRFLLVSGQPLKEPVARGGPFVMNTQEEIAQAFDDFRNNRF